jgi:lipoyl(octanoyl) transferase
MPLQAFGVKIQNDQAAIEWCTTTGLTPYEDALVAMEARAAAIAEGTAVEKIWLVEHPPLYTAGTSAAPAELIDARFPVYTAGRGGRYTYHGPGQRVGYVMLNLGQRGRDVRHFVHCLEGLVIDALAVLGIQAWRAPGRIGIWTTNRDGAEAKIGAIGVRVRRWVTFHGFAINVDPDLSHFDGIIPCGLPNFGVTSIQELGLNCGFFDLDAALTHCFSTFLKKISSPEKSS